MTEVVENLQPVEDAEESEEEENEVQLSDPNFAIIVSFLEQFGSILVADKPPIMSELIRWLSNTDDVAPELQDLHVKLLRKIKKSVQPGKWENAIIKFCYSYGSNQDAWEVERFGYKKSNLSVKLRILKNLLEMQFDVNTKFKTLINAKPSTELRLEPFGKDKFGNNYWVQLDETCNIKIFQENPDDETFQVVASNREEFVTLIDQLKENKPIKPIMDDLIDEDSSSNSRTSAKEEPKTEKAVKPAPTQEYSIKESTDEFSLKQTITINKKKPEIPAVEEEEEEEDDDEELSDEEMEEEEEEEETEEIPEPVVHKRKKHKSS
ncbi:unnamed protein product [Diamesa hyperborea]